MTKRICIYCYKVGISIEFDTGNQLRRHVKIRHPMSVKQTKEHRSSVREYRKQLLLTRIKYNMKTYPL